MMPARLPADAVRAKMMLSQEAKDAATTVIMSAMKMKSATTH